MIIKPKTYGKYSGSTGYSAGGTRYSPPASDTQTSSNNTSALKKFEQRKLAYEKSLAAHNVHIHSRVPVMVEQKSSKYTIPKTTQPTGLTLGTFPIFTTDELIIIGIVVIAVIVILAVILHG